MKKYFKSFKAVICLMLVASVLLSAVCLVHCSMHECVGEGCVICHYIATQKNVFSVICLCYGIVILTLKLLQLGLYVNAQNSKVRFGSSLIAAKVKISC